MYLFNLNKQDTNLLLFGVRGFTIVELMVALVITMIIGGISGAIFLAQHKSVLENESVFDVRAPAYAATELFKRDFSQAGYGVLDFSSIDHPKNSAFYIEDGGQSAPDKIYLFDGSYIQDKELEKDIFSDVGYSSFHGTGTNIMLDHLNLDEGRDDDCYGSNCNEFLGGIYQYIITNSTDPMKKVARIISINGNSLHLDKAVGGGTKKSLASPAVYYCLDVNGTDSTCHPSKPNAKIKTLRRSNRSSGGRQSLASDIVDMQVAYKDKAGHWHCDGNVTNSCPMSPFIPGDITLIRITLISERKAVVTGDNSTIRAENGRLWRNREYIYNPYTIVIRPRNNIEFN